MFCPHWGVWWPGWQVYYLGLWLINTPAGQDGLKIDLASRLCVSLSSFHSSLPPDWPSCQRASALSLSPQAPRCRASLSPSSEVAGKGRALPFSEPPAVFQSLLRFSPQHLTARPCSSVPLCLGAAGLPRAGKGSFAGSCVSLPPARPGPARRHRRYVPPRTRLFGPLPLPSSPPAAGGMRPGRPPGGGSPAAPPRLPAPQVRRDSPLPPRWEPAAIAPLRPPPPPPARPQVPSGGEPLHPRCPGGCSPARRRGPFASAAPPALRGARRCPPRPAPSCPARPRPPETGVGVTFGSEGPGWGAAEGGGERAEGRLSAGRRAPEGRPRRPGSWQVWYLGAGG